MKLEAKRKDAINARFSLKIKENYDCGSKNSLFPGKFRKKFRIREDYPLEMKHLNEQISSPNLFLFNIPTEKERQLLEGFNI